MDDEAWNERYRTTGLVWSAEPNRFVAEVLAPAAPGRALDLACGEGRNALWLAGRGWQVTAVDFSPVALAKARELAEARGLEVEWVAQDVLGYEAGSGTYDLVLLAYLHLVPDDMAAVLRKAAAALAPGGQLFVVGHDAANPAEGVGGPQDPTVLYTPETVAAQLDTLRIERAERVKRPVDGAERAAIDALVLATRDR